MKKNLQLNADPMENKSRLLDLLRRDFAPVQSLADYDIYRKVTNSGCPDAAR
jgi:hypothetical protein